MYTMKVIVNGHYEVIGPWNSWGKYEVLYASDIFKYLANFDKVIELYDELEDVMKEDNAEKFHVEIGATWKKKIFSYDFELCTWEDLYEAFLNTILN